MPPFVFRCIIQVPNLSIPQNPTTHVHICCVHRGWSGRLGEFITHTGPSTSTDKVSATGSILHLWKANVKESETTGGEPNEVDLPESVAINYYTTEGVKVTERSSPAPAGGAGAADRGVSTGDQQKQQQRSGVFVWDQKELGAKPTGFVFSPEAPQLSVSDDCCCCWLLALRSSPLPTWAKAPPVCASSHVSGRQPNTAGEVAGMYTFVQCAAVCYGYLSWSQ